MKNSQVLYRELAEYYDLIYSWKKYRQEADKLFNGLSEGGKIEMPIADSPWGSYFGMFRDKYGIEWMVEFDTKQILAAITKYNYANIKSDMLDKKVRPDGRKFNQVRELGVEVSLLPRTHGSALFQRGQTQVLSIATLGSSTLEQLIEGPEGMESKRYIHHYSDGPYSYGQTGRMMGPSRRAIGHGALAEKAIEPVLPSAEDFPYAIRVVSEILAENGSSSMGSVCGSSLSLMDAGVPLKQAVAGVAMGIVTKSDDEYAVLTDIVGLEDFAGEMDLRSQAQ